MGIYSYSEFKTAMTYQFTKIQWFILITYSLINLLCASSISLQGPFYPMIAEQKEVTPTQYGFVFGVFSFTVFIMNLFVRVLIDKFGAVRISLSGISLIGVANILFGFVDKLNAFSLFFGLSVVFRVIEAVGYSMFRNAGLAIVSYEFSSSIQMAFSFFQSFHSTGQFLGPVIGGALFELGGFALPFAVTGTLLLCGVCVVLFLPNHYSKSEAKSHKKKKLYRIPYIYLGILTVFGVYSNSGLIMTIIEPHLKDLNLSPVEVGSVFVCNAIAFGFSCFGWSKLCEKFESPLLINSFSAIITICGLLLVGPAPYIPLEKSVYTCIFGLHINGVGIGGGQVAGFSSLNKGAKLADFPQNIQTYGIISSLFTSATAIGYFVGAQLGGYLYEKFKFPWGSHFFILYHLAIFVGSVTYLSFYSKKPKNPENVKDSILTNNIETTSYESLK